jgi:mannose-6-phosphate isomerase-like protein (cupin superfamily)
VSLGDPVAGGAPDASPARQALPVVRSLGPLAGRDREVIFGEWSSAEQAQDQLLDIVKTGGLFVGWASYPAGSTTALIRHDCDEMVIALNGEGSIVLEGGGQVALGERQVALIPEGMWHGMFGGASGLEVIFCFPAAQYPPTDRHGEGAG